MYSIRFKNSHLFYLDQTKLPLREVWRECRSLEDGYRAIKQLRVRGAPLIGVFAAYCIYVTCKRFPSQKDKLVVQLKEAIAYLKSSRPTAINLFWALERIEKVILDNREKSSHKIKKAILREARAIHREDIELCKKMAFYGVKLIKKGDRILTHCNTGFLATSGEGTALAIIYEAERIFREIKVYVDETRPLLQGGRLTAWELTKRKVPFCLISDNTAAYLMQRKEIDKIIVGADRITSNGDVANKIGTYNLGVLAFYHKVPFYVAAPFSSFDLSIEKGEDIPIERRGQEEVRKVLNKVYIAPKDAPAVNFAFDVTPHHLISAIVTDRGIITPPFKKNIKRLLKSRCGK
jgi:methylthioribose-1-phosphate isomerase